MPPPTEDKAKRNESRKIEHLSPEKQEKLRERWRTSSSTYRARKSLSNNPPSLTRIASADKKIIPGQKGLIEMHPLYENSPYALPEETQAILKELREQIIPHPTGKRTHVFMSQSAPLPRPSSAVQSGGKKDKKK